MASRRENDARGTRSHAPESGEVTGVLKALYWRGVALWMHLTTAIPRLRPIHETRETQTPITVSMWFMQKVIGINRAAYWPVHFTSKVIGVKNIYAGIETCPGYSPGCYIQGIGKIYVGDYTQIGPNVGIISADHDPHDNRHHPAPGTVKIGKYGWIGMNAVILPGVELGDYTVVGAGSVVTHSFPEGYCVIGGNPARLIRRLDREKCVFHQSRYEYNGYVPSHSFEEFRVRNLNV
jgi:acetyltransferase-like isoleucine patch superfamily enzyme